MRIGSRWLGDSAERSSCGLTPGSGKSGGLTLWGVGGTPEIGVVVCWALAIVVAAVRLAKVEGTGELLI